MANLSTRIIKETQKLTEDPVPGISVIPDEENARCFHVDMAGPEGSPFEGGVFKLELLLPDDYPMSAPKVRFITKPSHPNIDKLGRISLDILKDKWSPALQIRQVLLSIQALLSAPNPDDPLENDVTEPCKETLASVQITSEVMKACWTHAHSNEKEEVMGLLLGQVLGLGVVKIIGIKILKRLVKIKDRVEPFPMEEVNAFELAENLSKQKGVEVKVIGWYHCHPHITVWPSHVDLRTQANYQGMHPFWVGLIFSVYDYNPITGVDSREVTVFQTNIKDGVLSRRDVPLSILNVTTDSHVLNAITCLPSILKEEETEDLRKASGGINAIKQIENQAIYIANLSKQQSVITVPLLESLNAKIKQTKARTAHLRAILDKKQKEKGNDQPNEDSTEAGSSKV